MPLHTCHGNLRILEHALTSIQWAINMLRSLDKHMHVLFFHEKQMRRFLY
jgi:hypothetical protein